MVHCPLSDALLIPLRSISEVALSIQHSALSPEAFLITNCRDALQETLCEEVREESRIQDFREATFKA